MSTDPVTLAREVLDDERAWAALDPGHHPEGQAAVYRLANAAPTLAHAVIDLTAKVERVEALADRLEREADELNGHPSRLAAHTGSVKKRTVARIRTALNGENHD